jgi:hypothetical protein
MFLNPLAFDSEEEFQKALNEEGRKQGWTPSNIINILQHSDINFFDERKKKGADWIKKYFQR